MKSGIYRILNKVDGKFYIGSAVDIDRRWRQHRHELRFGKHANDYLQNAWNKHTENSFQFMILEFAEIDKLQEIEQSWLDDTKCFDREIGYNISFVAANITGYKHTEASKQLMKEAGLGKKKSEVHKINIGLGHRNINKWPCPDGCKCKCGDCNFKRYEYKKDYDLAGKILNVQI